MKPTFNAISPEGQKTFTPTFDTFGFFARSVEDLELIADVFKLRDDVPPKDMPLERLSIALTKTPMWSSAGPGTPMAMAKAVAILEHNRVKVTTDDFPMAMGNGQCGHLKNNTKGHHTR